MSRHFWALAVLVSGLFWVACKRASLQSGQRTADATSIVLPQKVSGSSPTLISAFDIDEKSGRPKSALVLRLDYFPDPKPGRTTLPACFRSFPGDFALGYVHCSIGDGPDKAPMLAKYLDQECYTNSQSKRINATETLLMVGCQRGEVYIDQFDPLIRVDVETR